MKTKVNANESVNMEGEFWAYFNNTITHTHFFVFPFSFNFFLLYLNTKEGITYAWNHVLNTIQGNTHTSDGDGIGFLNPGVLDDSKEVLSREPDRKFLGTVLKHFCLKHLKHVWNIITFHPKPAISLCQLCEEALGFGVVDKARPLLIWISRGGYKTSAIFCPLISLIPLPNNNKSTNPFQG